jgi:hypothetical protein
VSLEVDELLSAPRRDDWSLLVRGRPTPVPPWMDWLIWLGQWMRAQAPLHGRRIAVVRMPSRRLGAAITAIGSSLVAARLHDDSLDWEALRALSAGTKVFWRETASGRSVRRSGTVAGVRSIEAGDFMEVVVEAQSRRAQQISRLFAKSAALTYGITLGAVSAVADERLSCADRFFNATLTDGARGWIRSPGIDCSIITERSSFLSDLEGLAIRIGKNAEGSCGDILAVADSGGRSHGKVRVAPARTDGVLDESGLITILDGASSALRLRDTVTPSVVVLLDHSEYDEEIEQLFHMFTGYAVDDSVHPPASGAVAPPQGLQAFVFGLPGQSR